MSSIHVFGIAAMAFLFEAGASTAAPSPALLSEAIDASIARAAETHASADELRRYIGSAIALETYQGAVKGPRGAYATAGGNSVDRALLLEQMIRARGDAAELRFAACDGGASLPASSEMSAATPDDGAGARLSDLAAGADASPLAGPLRSFLAAYGDAEAWRDRLTPDLSAVIAPLDGASAPHAPAAAVRHVWLQVAGDEGWRDLDTTTPDGKAPCAAEATWAELPPEFFPEIAIELNVRRRDGAPPLQVLAATYRSADIATSRIALVFAEAWGLMEPAEAGEGGMSYTPSLRVDGAARTGVPIVMPRLDPGQGGTVAGGFDDAIGALGGGEEPADAPDDIVEMRLRIHLAGPGDGHSVETSIFDLSGHGNDGPAMARADGDYAPLATLWRIGLLTGALTPEFRAAAVPGDPATADGLSAQLDRLVRLLPGLHRSLGGRPLAGPAIVVAGLQPTDDTPDGGARLFLDVLHMPTARAADAPGAARDAVALLEAERLLVASAGLTQDAAQSSSEALRSAKAQDIPLVLVREDGDAALSDFSEPVRARMAAAFGKGQWIATPAHAPEVAGAAALAWWVVDPATGLVRDVHENGRHSEVAEDLPVRTQAAASASRAQRLFCRIGPRLMDGIAVAGLVLSVGMGGLSAPAEELADARRRKQEQDEAVTMLCRTP